MWERSGGRERDPARAGRHPDRPDPGRTDRGGVPWLALDDLAPPLDFGLAGLPDWPGIRVRDRLAALRRHPLAMESLRTRETAWTALLGADGRAPGTPTWPAPPSASARRPA